MSSVLGSGERKHGPGGNSSLTLIDFDHNRVVVPLWISSFATDLSLQLDSAQLRRGLSHRPIRIAERYLTFSTLWNVRKRERYTDLVDSLKEHWAENLNEARPTPMTMSYPGANKRWRGYIENASFAYAVTDVVLSYQFQMRLINSETQTQDISHFNNVNAPYVPHIGDIRDFGPNWYAYKEYVQDVLGGNEGALGAKGQDRVLSPGHNHRAHT